LPEGPRLVGCGTIRACGGAARDEIVAFDLTDKEVDDASHGGPLLEQVADAPASFMDDGAYDRAHVLAAVLAKSRAVGL
jgi:hypothetical protein